MSFVSLGRQLEDLFLDRDAVRCVLKQGCGEGGRETIDKLVEETANF